MLLFAFPESHSSFSDDTVQLPYGGLPLSHCWVAHMGHMGLTPPPSSRV